MNHKKQRWQVSGDEDSDEEELDVECSVEDELLLKLDALIRALEELLGIWRSGSGLPSINPCPSEAHL